MGIALVISKGVLMLNNPCNVVMDENYWTQSHPKKHTKKYQIQHYKNWKNKYSFILPNLCTKWKFNR